MIERTTKDNPAAFQQALPLRYLKIIKNAIRKIIRGQFQAAKYFLYAEIVNYLSQLKKKKQLYCNLCKSES